MKRRMLAVVVLVLICLGVLVVEGVSQPVPPPKPTGGIPFNSPPFSSPTATPSPTVAAPATKPDFSAVQPQQEWTFEQLVEALKGVRARQKDLEKQEADLLTKIAEKVEEKRQDLSKSEVTLQQLRNENRRAYPPSIRDAQKMEDKRK